MKRIAAKADLGVPASDVRPDNEEVHADLARANVLRLRGDFAEAEQICVKVLESSPESAAAHTLLGDIAMAQDRPQQAAEHYDIAQSLDPFAPDISRKLGDARALQDTRETDTTAEALGLPPRRPLPWHIGLYGVGGALLVLVIVILFARAERGNSSPASPPIQATVDTIATRTKPKSVVSVTSTAPSSSPAAAPATGPVAAMTPAGTDEDRDLWQALSEQNPLGSHLLNVIQDPRARSVVVSYFVAAGEDPRPVGAELAKGALERSRDSLTVTLRALRNDQLIFMADVPRARYDETLSESWQHANQGEDAWIAYCMTNEWPFIPVPAAGGTSAAGPDSATSATTTSGAGSSPSTPAGSATDGTTEAGRTP